MKNNYSANIPIYLQIMDDIKKRIAKGELCPGERLPSVRDMSVDFEVNPNTMQKALSLLEGEGLLYSERTSGRFVTERKEIIEKTKIQMARQLRDGFINSMKELGFTTEEMIEILKNQKGEIL